MTVIAHQNPYPRVPYSQLKGFCIICLFFVQPLFSQKKLQIQADTLFQQKRYQEASVVYQKLYEKNKERTSLLRLGDSYFLHKNYVQAGTYYGLYFQDTLYQPIPQFSNFAFASKQNVKIELTAKLYEQIYQNNPKDTVAKTIYEYYRFYRDSIKTAACYDLDLNYNCILLDATESIDSAAAPLAYLWDFGNGNLEEGVQVEHCFTSSINNKVVLHSMDKTTGSIKYNDTTLLINIDGPPLNFSAPKLGKQYFYINFEALPEPETSSSHTILDYIWEVDQTDRLDGKKVKYQFKSFGTHEVKLSLVLKSKASGTLSLLCAFKKIEINDNYSPNEGKSFPEIRDEGK